ncbi:MAG TPA: hypothetical protein VM182_12240 [Terriglobia bacterium]|nr:hypothetical protein [Terriglobia bacterium]
MTRRYRRPSRFFIVLTAVILAVPATSWAVIKLYLRDGTYQLVQSYEIVGKRVRYYSIERSEWEELPVSLVDFAATKRAQSDEEESKEEELEEARELSGRRFDAADDTGFEVAPGIRLPQDEGVYAFDGLRVIRMIQSSGEVVKDKKRAALLLALPGPFLKNRGYVVLPGKRSAIRILNMQPTFYVRSSDDLGNKLQIITLKSRKEAREVERLEWRGGVATPEELRAAVPIERSEVAPGILRISPTKALELGEYALGELVQEQLNLELWDFGIEGAPLQLSPESESPPTIRRSGSPPQN